MPNRAVFLDTNGWLALLNASDTLHKPAVALWEELVGQGWSRTDPGAPTAHRIAVTERFARVALREGH